MSACLGHILVFVEIVVFWDLGFIGRGAKHFLAALLELFRFVSCHKINLFIARLLDQFLPTFFINLLLGTEERRFRGVFEVYVGKVREITSFGLVVF